MVDTNEVNRLIREILKREQKNAHTLDALSAKTGDPAMAQQLREMAAKEQQTANELAQLSYVVNNASSYAGTGLLNRGAETGVGSGDGETFTGDYTEVLTNYDGSGKAD